MLGYEALPTSAIKPDFPNAAFRLSEQNRFTGDQDINKFSIGGLKFPWLTSEPLLKVKLLASLL